jgi:uncharacterized protein YqgV (UPF0045/DUF77 family)
MIYLFKFLYSAAVSPMGVSILVVIITAVVTSMATYWFGLSQYLKQREREEIRKTYIEGGIGKVLTITEKISAACYSNYSKALTAVSILERSLGDRAVEEKLVRGIFSEMHEVKVAPDYANLKLLIFGNGNISLWVVKSWAEYQMLNEFLRYLVFQEFETYFSREPLDASKKRELVVELRKMIRERWLEVITRHEPLRGQLLLLQVEADKAGVSRMDDLDEIEHRDGVKKIINEIEQGYEGAKKAKEFSDLTEKTP